jgi:pimeloyl-ACP methyl ester carboxylesterase
MRSIRNRLTLLLSTVLLAACAASVSVVLIDERAEYRHLARNAMSDDALSEGTRDTLRRLALHELYESQPAVAYSAERLREALNASLASLGGAVADPALGQIVLIGHSQGGLLARLAAIEPEERLSAAVSRQPLDELQLSPASRHLIQRSFFFQPARGVHRIIFTATPHGGSTLVDFRITRLFSRPITLPATILEATGEVLAGYADDATADRSGMGTGSLGSM